MEECGVRITTLYIVLISDIEYYLAYRVKFGLNLIQYH